MSVTAELIPLWRDRVDDGAPVERASHALETIFASGRQALSASLRALGLGRSTRVAIPEWSSACVISSVGAVATPIPFTEVLTSDLEVDAVLVYLQWGWRYPDVYFDTLRQRFPASALILDRVDEPCLPGKDEPMEWPGSFKAVAEVWSLSKTLGLSGGGLARVSGEWLHAPDQHDGENWARALANLPPDVAVENILKSYVTLLPESVRRFVSSRDLCREMQSEATARRENLKILMDTLGPECWPDWMSRTATAPGATAGIAPLGRGAERDTLRAFRDTVAERHGLECREYHFNFSDAPLNPSYEACLACPVHGLVDPDRLRRLALDIKKSGLA